MRIQNVATCSYQVLSVFTRRPRDFVQSNVCVVLADTRHLLHILDMLVDENLAWTSRYLLRVTELTKVARLPERLLSAIARG